MPKILAPVRDEISLKAAIDAGADAVYFGIGELNMRISSKGIELDELPRIVELAHKRNVQVFITLNVIVYDYELEKLEKILLKVKEAEADAVICWDLAVIQKCQELNIPFHISTQASISNTMAAKYYENLGAKCLVLARECTLDQIKEIKNNIKKAKIEVFCHGAMCVSISGRCFLSNFLECKSANRGECFQPCRREYTIHDKESGHELDVSNGFVMSPKDLCTIEILDKIIDTGVDYLKIEGRGRSPEYIKIVTGAYRQALDAIAKNKYTDELKTELLAELRKVYNRGFSTGFLFGRPAEEGWSRTRDSQATEKKVLVGGVVNYFKKTKIADIKVLSGKINLGDTLQIQGKTTGVARVVVKEIKEHENNQVTFPCDFVVRGKDEVYKIVDSD